MISLNSLIKFLYSSPSCHKPQNNNYSYLNELSQDLVRNLFNKNSNCIDTWEKVGTFKLPYFEMGVINSTHLFGLDELIIFSYYIYNATNYKRAMDIGANIGLHSLILSKLGIKTISFEPDPIHVKELNSNLIKNNISKKVEVKASAMSNKKNKLEFCRVKGNTTGSHLVGSKKNPYGDLDLFEVDCLDVNDYFDEFDLIKLDAEGHEDVILCSIDKSRWKTQDVFVEVGSKENAEKIFKHFSNSNINLFSQKKGWGIVKQLDEIPFSYKEGSLFISKKNNMNWNL